MEPNVQFKPKKLGIKLKTEEKCPAIVLLYEQIPLEASPRKFKKCFRKRTMPVRSLTTADNSVAVNAEDLCARHKKYLSDVPRLKIEKMLRILQELMRENNLDKVIDKINNEFSLNPNEDLNQVDEMTLKRKKELMDEVFEKNRKKPGDADFEYDVEVDFDKLDKIETNEWDSGSNDSDFFG